MRRARKQDGTALIEAALMLPLLLLIGVGIFDFGRAYQTWEIVTNASREGARMAILPAPDSDAIKQRVKDYLQAGQLPNYADATIDLTATTISVTTTSGTVSVPASQVQVSYPFDFIALGPVAKLIPGTAEIGDHLAIQASVVMRNE